MTHLRSAVLAAALLLLAACSTPLPEDRLAYAGEWRAQGMYLLITPEGKIQYKRQRGSTTSSISAPIKQFVGDDFVAGIGPFQTTFHVMKTPYQDDGAWKMVVDSVELTRR